jgi:hypothetical protein
MLHHIALTKIKLALLIRKGDIRFGGNKPLKIYGKLSVQLRQANKNGKPCVL